MSTVLADQTHPVDTRPNLFILGAMKSGTSSLHSWLGAHPQIFMSAVKEPGYFVEELGWQKGPQWYADLFVGFNEAKVIGESSTEYTKLPTYQGVPEKIMEFSPDAKFIYLMRDPVERSISHYWHNLRSWRRWERRDLMAALREDSTLVDYSHYAMQLRPYLEKFGEDRVLTMTMEELSLNVDVRLRSIFGWLGVDEIALSDADKERKHQTPQVVTQKVGWLYRLRFSPFWNHVGPLVPSLVRKLGLRFSVQKSIDRKESPHQEAVEYLRSVMQEPVMELRDLLGRDFPEWKTFSGEKGRSLANENQEAVIG